MAPDKKELTASGMQEFTSFRQVDEDNQHPTRDSDNKKLDAADLFTQFTANIIKEDVAFTR